MTALPSLYPISDSFDDNDLFRPRVFGGAAGVNQLISGVDDAPRLA
jgi:hypothetical protein